MRIHTTEDGNQYEVNEAPLAPSAAIAAAGYITDFDYEGDWPTLDVNDPSLSDANVDGQGGTAPNGKPIYDLDQVIANLNRTSYPGTDIPGPGWSGEGYDAIPESGDPMVLSFGFHTAETMFAPPYVYTGANGGLFGRSEYFGFAPFTAAQEAAARDAIRSWDDLIAPTIVETSAADADASPVADGEGSFSAKYAMTHAAMPMGTLIQKVQRQPGPSVSQPPSSGTRTMRTSVSEFGRFIGSR